MNPRIRLLTCGIVAGPLFLALWAAQAFTREGFDPARHPISLLSLGGPDRIQIGAFGRLGERGRAAGCVPALVAVLAVMAWPDSGSLALRLLLGTAIQFAFLAAVALRALRDRERIDV